MYSGVALWPWCSTTRIARHDFGCLPRSSGASLSPHDVDHRPYCRRCAPHTPPSWSHSTRSWMPMEYSYALCRGRSMALCSWIAGRSCRWSVTQHEIMSALTLCSASGSVTCGLVHLHSTLG
eukprot:XP_001707155.1 Hypothetical protein GL50803_31118 [Giardia lamblia ATCC 50803]